MIQGELITSMPIDAETEAYIAQKFNGMLGEPVSFTKRVDESILGGFVAIINGKVYDGSVRSGMKTMKDFITDY